MIYSHLISPRTAHPLNFLITLSNDDNKTFWLRVELISHVMTAFRCTCAHKPKCFIIASFFTSQMRIHPLHALSTRIFYMDVSPTLRFHVAVVCQTCFTEQHILQFRLTSFYIIIDPRNDQLRRTINGHLFSLSPLLVAASTLFPSQNFNTSINSSYWMIIIQHSAHLSITSLTLCFYYKNFSETLAIASILEKLLCQQPLSRFTSTTVRPDRRTSFV